MYGHDHRGDQGPQVPLGVAERLRQVARHQHERRDVEVVDEVVGARLLGRCSGTSTIMCPTTTMVTSTILALSSQGSRTGLRRGRGLQRLGHRENLERQGPRGPSDRQRGRGLDWRPWPCPGDSEWRRTPSSCATSASCCRRLAPRITTTSSGPCRAAGSTTARTRGTPWSARSARRPASTRSSASRLACTPPTRPRLRRDGRRSDYHALRIVYDGWVPPDAPEPRVVEVDGSTVDSAWLPLGDVLDGTVPTVPMVPAGARPTGRRSGCSGSARTPSSARRPSRATCCSSGSRSRAPHRLVEPARRRHRPRRAAGRGAGPRGRGGVRADRRGRRAAAGARRALQRDGALGPVRGLPRASTLVFAATVPDDAEPHVVEVGGTTDRWRGCRCARSTDGSRPVLDVVHEALAAAVRKLGR